MPTLKRAVRRGNSEELAVIENLVFIHAMSGSTNSASIRAKLIAEGYNSGDVNTAINNVMTNGKYGQTFVEK